MKDGTPPTMFNCSGTVGVLQYWLLTVMEKLIELGSVPAKNSARLFTPSLS